LGFDNLQLKNSIFLLFFLITFITVGFGQATNLTLRDVAEKTKLLQKQLSLSPGQASRIKVVLTEESDRFEKIAVAYKGDLDKLIVKIAPLRTETIKRIKSFLNPQQVVKFDELLKRINDTGADGNNMGRVAEYIP
jgi:hypothetical protein